jgi:hypothetical protein
MTPLPGNEADHLREKARRDLLDLLESVSLFTYCFRTSIDLKPGPRKEELGH